MLVISRVNRDKYCRLFTIKTFNNVEEKQNKQEKHHIDAAEHKPLIEINALPRLRTFVQT